MSFTLPKVGEFFEEVIYADQPESKSKTIVDEYIKEGRSYRSRTGGSGSEPPFKRSRFEDRPRHGGGYSRDRSYDDRGGYRRGGGGGGSYQRFGGRPYHGGGGYRGGRGGGYHDRRDHRGGGGRGIIQDNILKANNFHASNFQVNLPAKQISC